MKVKPSDFASNIREILASFIDKNVRKYLEDRVNEFKVLIKLLSKNTYKKKVVVINNN